MEVFPTNTQGPPTAADTIPGPVQYLRKASLVVGKSNGQALDFSQFQFTFNVRTYDLQTPNNAEIRIYNVAYDTMVMVRKEFTTVNLNAGYNNNFGQIFTGTIKQARIGRIGVDNYLELAVADGDTAYNYSTLSVSLAAGATPLDIINACATALKPFGVTLGPLPTNLTDNNQRILSTMRYPRGVTLFGMTRETLRHVATLIGCTWSIQQGQLLFIPQLSYLQGDTVIVTSASGMINLPEQTEGGVIVRCLINPSLGIGRLIWINNKQINQGRYSLAYLGEVQNAQLDLVSIKGDGYYKILAIDYEGDTRGQAWYCTLTCIDIDGTIPLSQAARGRVIDTGGGAAP